MPSESVEIEVFGKRSPTPVVPSRSAEGLLEMLLAGIKEQSREGYRKDLAALGRFLGIAEPGDVAARLLSLQGRGELNALAAAWISELEAQGRSPATIRRRFAALARVCKAGRRLGLTALTPEAELPRTEGMRDTTGPGKRGWERMLAVAQSRAEAGIRAGVRDLAIVLLLHDRGIRRGELAGIDVPVDFDAARPAVQVLGKGKREKVWLTISDRSSRAILRWVGVRGDWPGPLFTRVDPASSRPSRLSEHGINEVVKALGRRAGLARTARAHGLRHQAVTEALDQGWSIRDTMAFSRHVDPRVVMGYDDRRKDVGGEVSKALAGDRRPPRKRR